MTHRTPGQGREAAKSQANQRVIRRRAGFSRPVAPSARGLRLRRAPDPEVREQRAEIPRHVHDPQDRTVRVLGVLHEQIRKPFHCREAEPARQQLKSPVPQQRATGHSVRRIRHGHSEFIRECRASRTCGNVIDSSIDIMKRSWREIFRPHGAAPYFSASRALTRAPSRRRSRSLRVQPRHAQPGPTTETRRGPLLPLPDVTPAATTSDTSR